MAEAKTLCIIDGHAQIYRAYYAPFRDLTSPTGEPTRATYVFCSMLLKFLAARSFDYLAMAIDGPSDKLIRRATYPEYKITRKPTPDDFHPQAQRIISIVRAAGIPVLDLPGYEADDIMATVAKRFAGDDLNVTLVSRDKDLDQLVTAHVSLYDPMKDETFDPATIEAVKGYRPDQAIEIQTLTGDATDNIPGVPGIGPKTAVKLIAKYGTADNVFAHADELTPKQRENVLASADTLKLSRELVTLDEDAPLDATLEDFAYTGVNGQALRDVFAELGFGRLIDQLDALGVSGESGDVDVAKVAAESSLTTAGDFDYVCIDTPEALADLAEQLTSVTTLAVDTETTDVRPVWAKLVGISLAWKPGHAVYIPLRGPLGATTLPLPDVQAALGPIFTNPAVRKVGHNFKYDRIVLMRAGFDLAGDVFDTMIASHVLDSSRMTYKMDALAAEMINHQCIPIENVIGRGKNQITMDTVPIDAVSIYAAEDADVTLRLAEVLEPQLTDAGLTELFEQLEMPLLPVLAQMECDGISLALDRLKSMEVDFSKRADELREEILELAGEPFNPDSPKQLATILFDKLGLPVIKKKKTGPSTDASVLEELAIEHALPGKLLDYRKLTKLLSTYLKGLATCVHPTTGRVHTSFNQAGTETGRLSSSDPNLQNIPIRTAEGRQIRSAFVAPEGTTLLAADYSQIELRILAHMSEDETLLAAFADDQDIHRIVAAEVFDVPVDDVTPEQRSGAKGVNFGIIYGQTAFGLSKALRIPRWEAKEFIDRYHARFPRIREFLNLCIGQAKDAGFVTTILGRRRAITEIDSRNAQRSAAAERLAINSVVQGSAADLIKLAMINIATRIINEDRPSKMLLQIHDELVFEIPEDDVDAEQVMITEEMIGAIDLKVPLKVDVGTGPTWLDAK
jgi:DNA polymerase I